jgi:nitrite reductase/ring-hydroxylating ferredoxin subunit
MGEKCISKGCETRFVRVCDVNDIPAGTGKSFRFGKVFLAVFHTEGNFYATSDICSHEYELLSDGWLSGHTVECPRHGAAFDIRTGEAKSLPATVSIEVFPLEVRDNDILVAIPVKYLKDLNV